MLKITIRDLFLFVLAVGLGSGWMVDHWRQSDALERANQRAAKATADAKELALFASGPGPFGDCGVGYIRLEQLLQNYGNPHAEPVKSDDFTPRQEQRMRYMLDTGFNPIDDAELHAKINRMLDRDKARQEAWARQYPPQE